MCVLMGRADVPVKSGGGLYPLRVLCEHSILMKDHGKGAGGWLSDPGLTGAARWSWLHGLSVGVFFLFLFLVFFLVFFLQILRVCFSPLSFSGGSNVTSGKRYHL